MLFSKELSIIKNGIKGLFEYRFDFIMWAIGRPFVFVVYYFLWNAVFTNTGQEIIRGFTLQQMISYYLIMIAVNGVIGSSADRELAGKVLNGDLIKHLIKPITYMREDLSETLGTRLLVLLINTLPLIIIGYLFFGVRSFSYLHTLIFAISVSLSVFISYLFVINFGVLSFWVRRYSGLSVVRSGIFYIFSGSVIPIAFFPQVVQVIFKYLPFQYAVYSPITIFLGKVTLTESLKIILMQIVWIFILYLIFKILWNKAISKFLGAGV